MPDQPQALVLPAKLNFKKMNNLLRKTFQFYIATALLIAIFFISDRYLKILSQTYIASCPQNLFGDFLTFTFVPNYYIAFSIPFSGILLNISIATAIIFLITYIYYALKKEKDVLLAIGLLFIVMGAISNFLDRLSMGYVIDYLAIRNITVFNLADVGISGGALISLISMLKRNKTTKKIELT